MKRIIGKLLHVANSQPPHAVRTEFYALKSRLLSRYGTMVGHDVQHIVKKCWTCGGVAREPIAWLSLPDGGSVSRPSDCWKCGGTGIYHQFWVLLERHELGGYTFHCPVERSNDGGIYWARSDNLAILNRINGYIEHTKYGDASTEAALWLGLLFDRALFWRLFTPRYGVHSRSRYPLMCLLWVVQAIRFSWLRWVRRNDPVPF